MPVKPVILRTSAVVAWGATIAADAANANSRTWAALLTAAAVLSLAALYQVHTARLVKVYEAMTRAILTRPFDSRDASAMAGHGYEPGPSGRAG
jgi:hypothetical protein